VLDGFDKAMLIFTKANADAGGRIINQIMEEYVSKNRHKSVVFSSLGRLRYLSAMKYCDAVIGNSSSGIVEAPSFKIGTINIGDRQKGRERAVSVIDCGTSKSEIRSAIRTLYLPAFKKQLKYVKNPYGDGKSSEDVVRILKNFDLSGILIKKFYDLEAKR
jgi:UDP-hydrolysing UDP-N-acetyl-D-glucosamine 2-epimerase